MTTIYKTYL